MCSALGRSCRAAARTRSQSLKRSDQPTAISLSWTRDWRCARGRGRRRRRFCSGKIGPFAGKKVFKDSRTEVRLRGVLIGPNGYRDGVVRIVKFGFDRWDFVLRDQKKISVHLVRHGVLFVVTDASKIIEDPWERIGAGTNNMSHHLVGSGVGVSELQDGIGELVDVVVSLNVNVRFGIGRAPKII